MSLPCSEGPAITALLDAFDDKPKHPQAPRLRNIHTCSKYSSGVADLIGYRIEESYNPTLKSPSRTKPD